MSESIESRDPKTIPSNLRKEARRATRKAYAPYSGFRVGAVLEDAHGRLFHGANIENASYPLGICAERVALLFWRNEGGAEIERVLIYAADAMALTPPCGLCRDALARWAPGAEVYLACPSGGSGPHSPAYWIPEARESK